MPLKDKIMKYRPTLAGYAAIARYCNSGIDFASAISSFIAKPRGSSIFETEFVLNINYKPIRFYFNIET
ncbi:hypothetical protein CHH65_19065 [Shouchella clausii]|nr:hypothetical protein CHI09_16595 [Shouchella clausii]PAF07816.1 hypothetical protein CHH65_19065 [Shouchella clausii]